MLSGTRFSTFSSLRIVSNEVVMKRFGGQKKLAKAPKAQGNALKQKVRIGAKKKSQVPFFSDGDGKGKMDSTTELALRTLKAPPQVEDDRTVEELQKWEQMAKEYSRAKIREHHALMGQLNKMLKMKYYAIAELPTELQWDAIQGSDTPVPKQRLFFTDTPAIPGFKGILSSAQK
eukprot:c774_g1_i1.p1 GENE.c774_g1_i1~~c774_g1_i1.p1  ORF type:complete len:175 (-),score=81.01 c774_g1_i1:50-574(-)